MGTQGKVAGGLPPHGLALAPKSQLDHGDRQFFRLGR
jgi:hypothetical protein